jgi:hypothetical protein
MIRATLTRFQDDGDCTLGKLEVKGRVFCTLEEPWKDNKRSISCIPAGTYRVVPHGWEPGTKVRFKRAYRLVGTEPRTAILIHTGNTTADIEGCILVGMQHGVLAGKQAVLYSAPAMEALRELVGRQEFILTIRFQKEEPRPSAPTEPAPPPIPRSGLLQRLAQLITKGKA